MTLHLLGDGVSVGLVALLALYLLVRWLLATDATEPEHRDLW